MPLRSATCPQGQRPYPVRAPGPSVREVGAPLGNPAELQRRSHGPPIKQREPSQKSLRGRIRVGAADQCKRPACWRGANTDWLHLILLYYVASGSDIGPEAIGSGIPELPESRGVDGVLNGAAFRDHCDVDRELYPASQRTPGSRPVDRPERRVRPAQAFGFPSAPPRQYAFRPSKIAYLSWHAWNDAETGAWPPNIPAASHRAYEPAEIKKWLRNFFSSRFFTSQFKRTAMPNGTKISSGGSLSLRGDWRRSIRHRAGGVACRTGERRSKCRALVKVGRSKLMEDCE